MITDIMTGADDSLFGDPCLICPTCREQYVHLGEVRVLTHPHSVSVSHAGVMLRPGGAGRFGRGSSVVISLWGECGHQWTLSLDFHKGATFVNVTPTGGSSEGNEELPEVTELWRD